MDKTTKLKVSRAYGKLWIAAAVLCLLCICASLHTSAASVNVVKTAKKVSNGTWKEKKSGMYYYYSNGKQAKNVWLKIDGKVYRFNSKGLCKTGWFDWGKNRYYADQDNGIYISRFYTVKKITYYFRSDGTLARSRWVKIDKKYYYFVSSGRMRVSSKFTLNGKTYYVDDTGARATSQWVTLNGKQYYFNKNGVMQKSRWLKLSGKYYYVGSDGAMAVSKWIDGYYVSETGARMTDCVIGGYYYNSTGKKTVKVFTGKYIFVGDSRIVGMSSAVSDSDAKFIGKVGMGLSWLKSTAGPTLKNYLDANPDVSVFLCFGINDLGNISSYITYYRSLITAYPNTKFYIVSVNPVNESVSKKYGYSVTNARIEKFNAKLKNAFSASYVDCYSYLKEKGFKTSDGIHYKSATYLKIYKYLIALV